MGSLVRFPNKIYAQRIGNDTVYGGGFDGNVVIASNTSLSRDMYYNNLTINSGVHLNTNGFRVFVRGTLTLNGTIGVKNDTSAATGTVSGNTPAGTSVTYSVGGSGTGTTSTQVPSSLLNDIQAAISGSYRDSSGALRQLTGGSGGTAGGNGTLTPGTDSPATWPNSAGTSGGNGQYPPNATTHGVPGGRGSDGTPGTRGLLATPGAAGIGGAGGSGGPVVLIAAKNVVTSGAGTVFSQGRNGGAKTNAIAPGPMHGGAAGSNGSSPIAQPGHAVAFFTYHHTRPAHHGGGDHHTTPLSPAHVDAKWAGYPYPTNGGFIMNHAYSQSQRYVYEEYYSTSIGGEPHFSANTHHDHGILNNYIVPAGDFLHLDGVDHNHYAASSTTGGAPAGGYAYLTLHNWTPQHYHHGANVNHAGANNSGAGGNSGGISHSNSDYTTHHRAPRAHDRDVYRFAGPALYRGHYSFDYPGGAAGSAGVAGPAGTAGSATEGTDGNPGGGGGIIFVTEAALPAGVSMNTAGGTSNSSTASAGMQIVILNN